MTGDDDRFRPHEPPLELELADVPRRLPRGAALHGADVRGPEGAPAPSTPGVTPGATVRIPDSPLPPELGELPARGAGGTTLLDGPSPWLRRGLVLVVLAAAIGVGYAVYRRFTRPDVYGVSSPYRSTAGVTVDLPPGGGWRTDRRLRVHEQRGPSWMRGDIIFRGDTMYAAREFAVLVRLHAPGGFARTMDREQLRSGLERTLQQQATAAGATARNLSCVHEDTWQSGVAEVCYGRLVLADRDVGAAAYLWVVNDDDLIGIVYATEDVSLDALEIMAKSAR